MEIKEGGTTFIRITDNGTGIEKEQVPLAFLRHATSKIRKVEDLSLISSLGFRGEALSSIAAVSRVELITKPHEQLIGVRYQIEGGMEKGMEEIGAPDGTTFLIRDLFYNTPARAKFLKTPTTEAGYISSFIEQLALSHPHISFKYMQNGQTKLHTSGNNNLKEAIYQIYGRDITRELIEIHTKDREMCIRDRSTTRTSRSTKTSWNPAVSWHIRWNTCHRSSRDSEMWTGENMYQHLRILDMTVIPVSRSRTRPLKIPRKRLRIL